MISRAVVRARAWRWWLAAALACAYALASADDTIDLGLFAPLGQDIVTGHLDRVYATDWNQAGPLQLLVSRLLALGSDGTRPAVLTVLAADLLVIAAVRTCVRRVRPPEVVADLAAVMTALWLGPQGLWTGHPAEALIAVLWAGATMAALHRRTVLAGVALGIAALIAPWAALGAPALLAGRVAPAVRSWLVAAAVATAGYLPFLLSGHFAMFEHVWPVDQGSLVHLLAPDLATFGWAARVVQAVVVTGGCAATAVALRGRREVVVLAPLAAAALRIVTDPKQFDYYWLPLGVLGVLAVVVCARSLPFGLLAALAYLPWGAAALRIVSPVLTLIAGAAYLLVLAGAVVTVRSGRTVASRRKPGPVAARTVALLGGQPLQRPDEQVA